MATIDTWSPNENYVQSNLVGGQFVSAAYTMLAAGPPRLAQLGGAAAAGSALAGGNAGQMALPIGIVQNFSLTQNMAIQQLFEIGSERSYMISGRTTIQLGTRRPSGSSRSLPTRLPSSAMLTVLCSPQYPTNLCSSSEGT